MTDDRTTVADLRRMMADFVRQRDCEQFHDPKNLSASIAIEAAELMEHFQWLRSDELEALRRDPSAVDAIGEELADVVAFVLSFANAMNIDIASTLARKMEKNARKYPVERFHGRFK